MSSVVKSNEARLSSVRLLLNDKLKAAEVGAKVGLVVGANVRVGARDGLTVGIGDALTVGMPVGLLVGTAVGTIDEGAMVGAKDGVNVTSDGATVDSSVGRKLGDDVAGEGTILGVKDGEISVFSIVGINVGSMVGKSEEKSVPVAVGENVGMEEVSKEGNCDEYSVSAGVGENVGMAEDHGAMLGSRLGTSVTDTVGERDGISVSSSMSISLFGWLRVSNSRLCTTLEGDFIVWMA